MSLDLNIIDFYHQHQQQPSTEFSDDTSSSSIVVDEDSNSIKNNRPLSTTLFFDILNMGGHQTQPPDPCGGSDQAPPLTMPLFPSPALSSSPAVVPQWLNLSFADSRKQPAAEPHWRLQNQQQQQLLQQKPAVKKSRRGPRSRSSPYRGVTFYRRTGRWESHIWDCGKQVYLGGFDSAHAAARAYDRAAIKFRGVEADINFDLKDYDQDMKLMVELSKEEFVQLLRRQSTGFTRASSKYRGVTLQKYGLGQGVGQSYPSWMFEREIAFARYNEGKGIVNIDTSTYGRGNLSVDPVDKGSDRTLDLSLGVISSSPHANLGGERHMFDRSAAPVLCGQPPPDHDFKKPSPFAWQFSHPCGSGYLSQIKKGNEGRRTMAQTNPPPRFQDQTSLQVPLIGSTMAPIQLLSAAASSGFPTGVIPAAPSHMWVPPCSNSPENAFSYTYRG